MESFSTRIAEARKARGMTQEQLAQMLHVSRQTVSHWENGRVLPDLAMAERISEALELQPREDAAEVVPTSAPDSGKGRRRVRWILAGAALLLGLVCGLLLGAGASQPDGMPSGQAVITVTPEAEEAPFLVNAFFPGGGWDVGFNFANVSDVPFRPSYLVARYYAGEEIVSVATVTYEQMLPWMAGDMLRQGDPPLRWPFGTDQLYMTGMECIIYGTDANGNELSFAGSVRYQRPPSE